MIEYTAIDELPGATSIISLDSTHLLIDPSADSSLRFRSDSLPQKPDLILLSHPDLAHLGGYVHGFKEMGWNSIPVYASLPVVQMGRTTMLDALRSTLSESITITDINDAFDWITSLRYSQAMQLSGKCQGTTITAYNAGHTLGGTFWKISRGSDQIIYAIDWNHVRDQHLNGAALFSNGQVPENLVRPSLFITDVKNTTSTVPARSKRNEALFASIGSTLESNGSVLIPIDTSARSLELCEMLENHWASTESIRSTPLYFLSYAGLDTVGHAQSLLEWMSDKMINTYGSSGGVFEFKHLKVLSTNMQVNELPAGPKVVLATSEDMDSGFSQRVLLDEIASNPSNLIVLSQRTIYRPDSLAGQLMQKWTQETMSSQSDLPEYITLDFQKSMQTRKQVPLEGAELKIYNKAEQIKKDDEAARAAIEERNRNILDAEDSESEDEDERAVLAASSSLAGRTDASVMSLGSSVLLNNKFDLYLRNPQIARLPARLRTFPFYEKRRRFDDYGELLKPGQFKRGDEEENGIEATIVMASSKLPTITNGKKRKWGEAAVDEQRTEDAAGEISRNVPTKIVVADTTVHVKCRLRYIDMEGLHDGTSLRNIIESVNPRKLVLVHGSEEEKKALALACNRMKAFTKAIVIPELRTTTEISLDTNAYDVRLSDTFAASLQWQKLYEQEVAHATGRLVAQEQGNSDDPPVLDILTTREDMMNATRVQALFVGDIRLADLRRLLIERGHSAELRGGGVLFCDGCVAVTKASAGEVCLEGLGSDHFYGVRDSVYSSLATIETN